MILIMKCFREVYFFGIHVDVFPVHLVIMAENGRLRYLDGITKKFSELTMAHRGEMKATVTTVIVCFLYPISLFSYSFTRF